MQTWELGDSKILSTEIKKVESDVAISRPIPDSRKQNGEGEIEAELFHIVEPRQILVDVV